MRKTTKYMFPYRQSASIQSVCIQILLPSHFWQNDENEHSNQMFNISVKNLHAQLNDYHKIRQ